MPVEDKLKHFRETVINAAMARKVELAAEYGRLYGDACAEIERDVAKYKQDTLSREKSRIDEDKNRSLISASRDVDLSLFATRNEITERFFDGVLAELTRFKHTRDYVNRVKKEARAVREQYAGNITFFINEDDDESLRGALNFPDSTVNISKDDIFGGFIAQIGDNIIIDFSYSERIAAAKAKFNKFKV